MVRVLLLIPLGILFGACAATLAFFILGANVPEFGEAFISAVVAAWRAAWFALIYGDDPNGVVAVFQRGAVLAALVLLAPVVLTAVIAEVVRLRGALGHLVLAGALAVALPLATLARRQGFSASETRVLACLFFTGAAAGLVYWLIAGRGREPPPPALPLK